MGLLTALLIDFSKAFFAGVMVFLLPPVLSRALPPERADQITNFYAELSMALLGKAILLIRSGGGMALKKAVWDTDDRNIKVYLGGDWKHFDDPHDFLSRWCGRTFGIAHEDRSAVISPQVMDIGDRVRRLREDGEAMVEDKHGERYWRAFVSVPRETEVVDPRGALSVVLGDAKPDLPERTRSFVEKGHREYNSSSVMQTMPWLIALGVGFGLMWIGAEMAARGASGGGGSVIALSVMPL